MSDEAVGMVRIVAQAGEKLVPIRHVVPDELPTLVSNHVVAQRASGSLCISFFEVRAPIVLDAEARRKQFEGTTEILARCVARISVPRDVAREFVAALQTQLGEDLSSGTETDVTEVVT